MTQAGSTTGTAQRRYLIATYPVPPDTTAAALDTADAAPLRHGFGSDHIIECEVTPSCARRVRAPCTGVLASSPSTVPEPRTRLAERVFGVPHRSPSRSG